MPLFLDDPTDDLPDQDGLHDAADRRDQVRQAALETVEACCCTHAVDDHWPREGCVRRDCLCWWWGP